MQHNLAPAKRKKNIVNVSIGLVILIIILRMILPYIILFFANKKLSALDGYYGHIRDIDLALYRGAYVIKDIYIDKTDPSQGTHTSFFNCPRIDLSVEWKALFDLKLVGEVEFERPVLQYTLDKTVGKNADKDSTDFIGLVKDFIPLRINRFMVTEGQIHYVDENSRPLVDVPLTDVYILGKGLTNESADEDKLPASIEMNGHLFNGHLSVNVNLAPLSNEPTFDLDGKLTETDLVNLNSFFTAYGNFDLKSGSMSVYTEFAANNGQFKGYVKPLIKDLDIVQFNKEEGHPLQITWEAFIGSTAEVFQNQPKGRLGSRIPVEGKFKHPEVRTFEAILSILKNAFIKALQPSIDHSVDINNINEPDKKRNLNIFGKENKK
jgi:hypothetical protein